MNQCSYLELENEQKKMENKYSLLKEKLSPIQIKKLEEIQIAWNNYVKLSCEFESSGIEGGSIHSMIISNCKTGKVIDRTKELQDLVECKEGDLNCPWKQG